MQQPSHVGQSAWQLEKVFLFLPMHPNGAPPPFPHFGIDFDAVCGLISTEALPPTVAIAAGNGAGDGAFAVAAASISSIAFCNEPRV